MRAGRRISVAAATVAASVAMVVGPAVAATTPLPVDLTGPSVTWYGFDNYEGVSGCTSARHYQATGDYLPGYGPVEADNPDTGDGFDGYALVTVGGTYFLNPDDDIDVDASGHVATSDGTTMSGVDVTVQHAALQSTQVLRTLVTLTNPGGAETAVTVTFEQDLGSDDATWVQTTSSGDDDWTVADRWVMTSEDEAPTSDPIITTALFGPGIVPAPQVALDLCGEVWSASTEARAKPAQGPAPTTDGVTGQAVANLDAQTTSSTFAVTIPAGETRYLAFFNSVTTYESFAPADAVTALYDAGLTGALAEGLDPAVIPYVVNWSPPPPVVIEPTFTG